MSEALFYTLRGSVVVNQKHFLLCRIPVHIEENLQYMDHELHWSFVIVQQRHAVERGFESRHCDHIGCQVELRKVQPIKEVAASPSDDLRLLPVGLSLVPAPLGLIGALRFQKSDQPNIVPLPLPSLVCSTMTVSCSSAIFLVSSASIICSLVSACMAANMPSVPAGL